jgi:hypothetical protein
MSLHSGTAAETERKKMLEEQGHIILNLGQNQYGDLEDVCCNVIIEVKSSKNGRRDISKREKEQMEKLLQLKPFRIIRYDLRFHGNSHHPPIWQEEYPDRIVSSFKLKPITGIQENEPVKIFSKSKVNKNMKVKK